MEEIRVVSPGPEERTVRTAAGQILRPPADWELLLPGDATLTRRVKEATVTCTVQEKRGSKMFSRGVWASAEVIARVRSQLDQERATPEYAKQREVGRRRRERVQANYIEDFNQAVIDFLAFHATHAVLATRLAKAVTEHATPVGSGTVARTRRITIEKRAEAAVIAWLRHETTVYDHLGIPRVKGKRREVRRLLAQQSTKLLDQYRSGATVDPSCPLQAALNAGTTASQRRSS